MCKRAVEVLFILCVLVSPLRAQEAEPSRERFGEAGQFRERFGMDIVSFEPQMFAADSVDDSLRSTTRLVEDRRSTRRGLVRVDILYRIRFDFFVFTRDVSSSAQSYRAHGDILIELIDSTETSVSRKVQAISLQASSNEIPQLRQQFYQGAASFFVKPGNFTAVYHVEDKESKREFADKKQTLKVPSFRKEAVVQSTVVFVEPVNQPTSEQTFTSLNSNNTANFAKSTGAFITISDADAAPSVSYSLIQLMPEGKERSVVQKETTATATLFRHSLLRLSSLSSKNVHYVLDSSATTASVYFTLSTAHLKQGRYIAQIHIAARDTASVSKEFSIRWIDMPISLFDLDFAVLAMKYITTDDEYDDLKSGSRASRIKKFEDFWAKRDPKPETAYNEVMTEYFRRVDYAFINFRTLKEENGVLTDRGRIFILYGKPTNLERVLAPGGPPKEIWTYASLGKQFIFEDPSRQGNYKLIASENK